MNLFGVVTSAIGRTVTVTSNYSWGGFSIAAGTRGVVVDEFAQGRVMVYCVRFTHYGIVEIPAVSLR